MLKSHSTSDRRALAITMRWKEIGRSPRSDREILTRSINKIVLESNARGERERVCVCRCRCVCVDFGPLSNSNEIRFTGQLLPPEGEGRVSSQSQQLSR